LGNISRFTSELRAVQAQGEIWEGRFDSAYDGTYLTVVEIGAGLRLAEAQKLNTPRILTHKGWVKPENFEGYGDEEERDLLRAELQKGLERIWRHQKQMDINGLNPENELAKTLKKKDREIWDSADRKKLRRIL
jgi:hypothetical protein